MIDKMKIQAAMQRRDLTGVKVAEMLGIGLRSWTRKINGGSEFTASEIEGLCRILHIKNPTPYFFTGVLASKPAEETNDDN